MSDSVGTFPLIYVAHVPFRVASIDGAAEYLIRAAEEQGKHSNVRLANAYNVALAQTDSDYANLLVNEGLNFPDGMPVTWFMNLQIGRKMAGRVRGPSLFPLTLAKSLNTGARHFLLGSTPETLARLEQKIRATYPGINLAGSYSPPFAPVNDHYIAECVERIQASNANIVWLGLGTPKQDQLGSALARRGAPVTVNVGAAFDFLAGTVKEAPVWIQRSGFEWFFRFASEPRRLWRRYLIGNAQFLFSAVSYILKKSNKSHVNKCIK